jgi:diguanylate cyclase (GGDEF)-like protein
MITIHNWQNYALSVVVGVAIVVIIYAIKKLFQARGIQKENKSIHGLILIAFVLITLFIAFIFLMLTSLLEPVHYFLAFSAYITAIFIRLAAKSNHELMVNLTKTEALEHYNATHDELTGLSNLTFFKEQLEKILSVSRRDDDEFALLVIGLNRFKVINETLGYFVGDVILQEIANRIRTSLRKTDLIARLGGDEFAVLINPMSAQDHIQAIAINIADAIQEPLAVEGKPTDVGVSIGVAVYPKHALNSIDLIEKATSSLIAAEKSGEPIKVYNNESTDQDLEDIQIIGMLQRAIQEDQLTILYQPQVRLRDEKIISAEALIRWQHPGYGLLDPGKFIPYAEKAGLIYEINLWLLKNITKLSVEWKNKNINIPIAMNITAHGFLNKDFQMELNNQIHNHPWLTAVLKIELTETSSIDNIDEIRKSMLTYKKMGIIFSLDDYGTKHASLEYLKMLPFDELKIDQSFMINAESDQDSRAIIKHAKDIAEQLKLSTTAEGIETIEVLEIAKQYGIHKGQGYYFSSAVTNTELEKKIQ